jgi:lambda family phage portal protein
VIKTDLDWGAAMNVLGAQAKGQGISAGNPISDAMAAHMTNAAEYAKSRELRFQGVEIPHLLPNESIDVVRPSHPNSNFPDFENAFIRHLAAGLGVEAHELGKNYREVNYSSARAALEAVWRTYKTRRNRLINQFARPFYGAWLEEAVWLGTVPLPKGVTNFHAAKPYLVGSTTFIAWGKPMIDPLKERQAQMTGLQNGLDTYESIHAEHGRNWRDVAEQIVYERARMAKYGLAHPMDMMMLPAPAADASGDPDAADDAENAKNGRGDRKKTPARDEAA